MNWFTTSSPAIQEGQPRPRTMLSGFPLSFVGKPRLLLIQQRNLGDFLGKLQEKVRISSMTF